MCNKEPLISIIIPVYNVENYLGECIESCLNQTYRNCELILIDDGSTDSSGEICDYYAKNNSRVICLHKINGGLSDARNYGMLNCNGDYVMFVDSDDIISPTIAEYLLDMIEETESDISVCCMSHFLDGSIPVFDQKVIKSVFAREDALLSFLYQKEISSSACAKLYKKAIIKDELFVKGQRFEDNDFLYRVLSRCKVIAYGGAQLYGYRHRAGSTTMEVFSSKDFDIIDIGKKILHLSSEKSKEVCRAATTYQYTNAMRIFLTCSKEFISDSRYIYSEKYLKEKAVLIVLNKEARNSIRIAALLFIIRLPKDILKKIHEKRKRWK